MVMGSVNPEPQLIIVENVLKSCVVKPEYVMKECKEWRSISVPLEKASSEDIRVKG